MQEAIGRVLRYTAGYDEAAFLRGEQTIDSVVRNIQITAPLRSRFGEARLVKRLSA